MNENGIIARLTALEILSATCLTFILASAASSPAEYSAGVAFVSEQEGVVDLLNIDPAVLNRLEGSRVFQ